MTDQELLQQAKDQVAQDDGFKDFAHFLKKVPGISFGNGLRANLLQRAALLAIQSAREEGREEGIKGGEATGYDAGYSRGYEQGYESGQADLKSGFDIKKLTAPGR